MIEWKTYQLSDLLIQYRILIKVENAKDYKQLTISKHDGVKYRCTKNGKSIGRKRQFLVDLQKYPNTLLFTRQGVKDGSIGLAPKEVDGCITTENMPMFSVNTQLILPKLLEIRLTSKEFKTQLNAITPTGSAQKAIHERLLLQIKITIPENIDEQKKLINQISTSHNKINDFELENERQSLYLSKLKQSILQEAIEGKLTETWRKENPVCKGNPDYDAKALVEKIKAEKAKLLADKKIKKQKPLAPINNEEMPFELPEGWIWTRLGEIASSILGKMLDKAKNTGASFPYLRNINVRWFDFNLDDLKMINLEKNEVEKFSAYKGDLLICEGGYPGRAAIWNKEKPIVFQKALHRVRCYIPKYNHWILYYLKFLDLSRIIEKYFTGAGIQHLTGVKLKNIEIPLPPIEETKIILERVEKLLSLVDKMEKQVTERKGQAEQLKQSVLREAFEGQK